MTDTPDTPTSACAGEWAEQANKLLAENVRLRDAAENVVIAHGMGWDMDGVIEKLRDLL